MKYPDGEIVVKGDDVIFDEGDAFGYVIEILSKESEWESYGLHEPTILIGMIYPKDDATFMAYPGNIFSREKIRKQSSCDKFLLNAISNYVIQLFATESDSRISFSVRRNSIEESHSKSLWDVNVFMSGVFRLTIQYRSHE